MPTPHGPRLLGLLLGLGLAPLLGACPGSLEDPERFTACRMDVERELLAPRCATSGCHSAETPAANLDLASPGLAARLASATSTCEGRPLTLNMQDKVQPSPTCGSPMPLGGTPLNAQEMECLALYLQRIEAGGSP
ncbi:MAG TPA: hypothetical protein VF815_12300 [Myxococcaceae bacterium]|jgi:hypothetical protein